MGRVQGCACAAAAVAVALLACGEESGPAVPVNNAGTGTMRPAATGGPGPGPTAVGPNADGPGTTPVAPTEVPDMGPVGPGPGPTGPTAMMDAGAPPSGGVDAGVDGGGTGPAELSCDVVIPPSSNCGDKLAPGDERTCMLGSRKYIVHAGKTMNPCEPVALVIDAHGATETAEQQLGREEFCAGQLCWAGLGSGWAAESDTPGGGFIAVFPQGISNRWSASDASFMLDIVEEMKKLADIDPDKVYISGISNGGFLTFQTGCPNSDVFRGMAPNAGGSSCSSVKRPIPLISFDAEPDFAYDGHKSANASVVQANHCQGDPKPWVTVDSNYTEAVCRTAKQDTMAKLVPCNEVTSAPIEPTECVIWDECDEGAKVVWCDVAPNTEHGASNASTDAHIIYENNTILNTPSLAWRFFKSFW